MYDTFTFDKFLAFPNVDSDTETFRRFVDEHFSCFIHDDAAWEITQKHCSKATGIQFRADRLDIPIENTFAFGDSTNDLAMLQYAGISVAMGNSSDTVKKQVDFVTRSVEDEGVAYALEHFGFVKQKAY